MLTCAFIVTGKKKNKKTKRINDEKKIQPVAVNWSSFLFSLLCSVPVTTSRLDSKLWLLLSVVPPILPDHHLYTGSCSLLPHSWPTTAPQATFLPWAPAATIAPHRPTRASSLLCHAPLLTAPLHLSAQSKGWFWFVLFYDSRRKRPKTSNLHSCFSMF